MAGLKTRIRTRRVVNSCPDLDRPIWDSARALKFLQDASWPDVEEYHSHKFHHHLVEFWIYSPGQQALLKVAAELCPEWEVIEESPNRPGSSPSKSRLTVSSIAKTFVFKAALVPDECEQFGSQFALKKGGELRPLWDAAMLKLVLQNEEHIIGAVDWITPKELDKEARA